MILHREHEEFEQNSVTPLSPMLHVLVVPCHLRFSFPRDFLREIKFPLASTRSLCVSQRERFRDDRGDGQVLLVFL